MLIRYIEPIKLQNIKSKVDDLNLGWPEGFLFNSYYTEE